MAELVGATSCYRAKQEESDMYTINRRQMLAGSGMALALASCDGDDVGSNGPTPMPLPTRSSATLRAMGSFEDSWHHGDQNPKDPHPSGPGFTPSYAALLHLRFNEDFELEANRVHFRVKTTGANTFENNVDRFEAWINYYNDRGSRPSGYDIWEIPDNVLENFAFSAPHHFLVYIRNKNISYDPNWPIWFGKKLTRSVFGETVAQKNYSFFDIKTKNVNVLGGSRLGVYAKNYYHVRDNGNYRPIGRLEKFAYAFNINALARVDGYSTHTIPIIIDPDTGNMGDGAPLFGA